MFENLPREILELIFTHPLITKKTLLQLQLTCKQWSPAAQKHLYKTIDLKSCDLYGYRKHNDPYGIKERFRLLLQTLLLCDIQIRSYVMVIDVDFIHYIQDPISKLATVVNLCPNITTLDGSYLKSNFYESIANLHSNKNLKRLESIASPNFYQEDDKNTLISTYNQTLILFRDTLKTTKIIDSAGKTYNIDHPVQPDDLQHFSRLEHLHMEELSRFHLFQLNDYLSKCHFNTKSIHIDMYEWDDVPSDSTLLLNEYNNQQASVTPQTQVQKLKMQLHFTPDEMSYVMRIFPSLKNLEITNYSARVEEIVPIQRDMDVVWQFLKYLSLIPRVVCNYLWFGVSEGLGLLPLLATSFGIQELTIASFNAESRAALTISLDRETQVGKATSNKIETIKTKRSLLAITVESNDSQVSLRRALKSFRDKSVKTLNVGIPPTHHQFPRSELQLVNEETMDYIMDKVISLQKLKYSGVEFPSELPSSRISRVKSLHRLDINYCKISENYFTKISCQLKHVDRVVFSTSMAYERKHNGAGDGLKIKIHLPYTTINTLYLSIKDLKSYTIQVWSNYRCTQFKAGESESTSNNEVIIHCIRLQKIRTRTDTLYKLHGPDTFKL